MKHSARVRGTVSIFKNGDLIRKISNLTVDDGIEYIVSRMKNSTPANMSHMAVGTGTTAAAAGDTTLGAEEARVSLNTAGGTVNGDTITYEATFPADTPDVTAPDTIALTEVGIFNAASGGTMLARAVFAPVNKGETDVMTVSWDVDITA